jgi:hypothetical protein
MRRRRILFAHPAQKRLALGGALGTLGSRKALPLIA